MAWKFYSDATKIYQSQTRLKKISKSAVQLTNQKRHDMTLEESAIFHLFQTRTPLNVLALENTGANFERTLGYFCLASETENIQHVKHTFHV